MMHFFNTDASDFVYTNYHNSHVLLLLLYHLTQKYAAEQSSKLSYGIFNQNKSNLDYSKTYVLMSNIL